MNLRPSPSRAPSRLFAGLFAGLTGAALAQTPVDLKECAAITDGPARLACFDKLVVRNSMFELPPSPAARPGEAAVAAEAAGAASTPVSKAAAAEAKASNSWMSRYWELADEDKRGTFNYTAYRPNFFLPLHITRRMNKRPYTPTQGYAENLPEYQRAETKIQLSLRTKIAQDLLLPGADLWVGYTQESLWQLYNHDESAPFRNTDYQPELIYVMRMPDSWENALPGGWKWKMAQLGFVHQSNGQPDPLSRSWNRLYATAGLEHGDLSVQWRVELRTDRKWEQDNNNPDIVDYLKSNQLQFNWTPGRSVAAFTWRPSLHGKGSIKLDWSYPVFGDRPDGLRWYAQLFNGYGESLLDYNMRQTSLGLGLTIFKF